MATISSIIAANASNIGSKTLPNSISPTNVAGQLDSITNELLVRGIKVAASTSDLATINSNDFKTVIVQNVGIFIDTDTGPSNDITIFDGVGGRFWELITNTGNKFVSIPYNINANWDYVDGNVALLELTGDSALTVENMPDHSFGILMVKQDATGGRVLTLPGKKPTDFSLITDPNGISLLAIYYDGENFFWSVSNYEGDAPPSGILEDINFPTQVGLTDTSGVWSGSNNSVYYDNYGLGDKKLASGVDGHIQTQYVGGDAVAAIIAFNTSAVNQKYTDNPSSPVVYYYEAAAFVFGGNLYRLDNNTAAVNTGVSISTGHFYRISRVGSVLKLQKSADESSWTDVYTYAFSSTADLYVNINIDTLSSASNKLYYPKGYNLTTI